MPEQEYLPPRRPGDPARSYRPDLDEEDPPPWADLPPVRPARPAGPGGSAGPSQDDPAPQRAQWDEPEAAENVAVPRPGRGGGRAMRAAARKRRRWLVLAGGLVVAAAIAVALKLRPKKLLPIAEKTDGLR